MDYKFKTKPYAHQLKALEMSWNKQSFAYFMEMGTGKSKVLIDNISMLYDAGKINGAVIVAPKGVYKTWYNNDSKFALSLLKPVVFTLARLFEITCILLFCAFKPVLATCIAFDIKKTPNIHLLGVCNTYAKKIN